MLSMPAPEAKFSEGDAVFKWTGEYTGPGIVRASFLNAKGQTRYVVSHVIVGGEGDLLHIYSEGNLRPDEGPSRLDLARRRAAYLWPDESLEHKLLRAAFMAGAAHVAGAGE